MTRYQRDKLKVWCVVARRKGVKHWSAQMLTCFYTRKECQKYIDYLRAPGGCDDWEHRPMMFLPAKARKR
jgi:hypothetical protein